MTYQLPSVIEQALRQLRATQVRLASEFERKVLAEGNPACRKGCNHCCHYPLYVTLLEGMLTYRWLSDNRRWTHKLQEGFKGVEARTWQLSMEIWMLSSTACPLLGEDGLCQSYKCRPLFCRTTYSRGDSHNCHPHRFHQAPLVPRQEVMDTLVEIEGALLKRIRTGRIILPFATAVLLGERICKGDVDLRQCNPFTMEGLRKW